MKTLLAIVVALAACGGGENTPDAPLGPGPDGPEVDTPPPREVHTSTQPLAAGGELAEAEMIGGAPGSGDRAIIELSVPTGTFDWNIHSHPGGQTVTVDEGLDATTLRYDFIPTEQAEWYLLLRSNATAIDVQVRVELYGALTFVFI
jgi:hypothetical protein